MRNKVIKVDVDGVIRDMVSAMCQIYNQEFGQNICVCDVVDYNVNNGFKEIEKRYNIQPKDYFFHKHAKAVFLDNAKPFPLVQEALQLLKEHGYKIVITTWQFSIENIRHTIDFIEKYNIIYDDICFTRDKWLVKSDYIIDDNPEFLLEPKEISTKICIRHPYNECIEDAICCNSLMDAAKYIIAKQNYD